MIASRLPNTHFRVAEFVAYLSPFLNACAYLYGRADELRGASVSAPAQGEIDPVSLDELNDPTIALYARSALLSFAICITAAGQSTRLVELEAEAKAAALPSCVIACLDLILGRTENLADPDISFTLRALESQDALAPEAMYRATLRLVQAAAASSFRPVLERPIVAWADGLAALASALLAAEPALNIRLAAELRHWLTSGRQSSQRLSAIAGRMTEESWKGLSRNVPSTACGSTCRSFANRARQACASESRRRDDRNQHDIAGTRRRDVVVGVTTLSQRDGGLLDWGASALHLKVVVAIVQGRVAVQISLR